MINQVYQLVAPRQFDVTYNNVDIYGNHVIVRPLYLSICAADQRYYTGRRDENVLRKKLPMSLVHEAVGEVVFDSKGVFEKRYESSNGAEYTYRKTRRDCGELLSL
ncbi:putative alcohol dehydrogenase [Staphylococcus aureus subsp. aureus MRGR3]|nr:putative alcohol dehydrogenase [Staphylococcus aureus subsp. aureus MRGR3]